MTDQRIVLTQETLFERIREEFEDISEESFHAILEELCECEESYLESHPLDEDGEVYMARANLKWTDFRHLSCPIKKQILLYLVENPKTFFVLLNTQKGKTAIVARHLTEWTKLNRETDTKIVPIIFMMNDRTLADQTQDTLVRVPDSKIFQLSSNSKTTEDEILTYIDAWSHDTYNDYSTPIILTLPNNSQMRKIVKIMERIRDRALNRQSRLRYAPLIDEFDQVYPQIRDKLLSYIECDAALHKLGFISATDGDTIDDYPECANAHFESHSENSPEYRAFHHADSVVKIITRGPKKHNPFAYKVIDENAAHFLQPIVLSNGQNSYRKIIVNGDSSRASMESFARKITEPTNHGSSSSNSGAAYCITINMFGVKLFIDGQAKRRKSIRGCRLNAVLYWLYKREKLEDKPLYVIGNRKVDRGLGFHYAPRKNETGDFDKQIIEFDGEAVASEQGEGLIFTDIILGQIGRTETAVQKAGRCAGIVAQCPHYCGNVHYWTDAKTAESIRQHNRKVDHMNELAGGYNVKQADTRARERLAQEPNQTPLTIITNKRIPVVIDGINPSDIIFTKISKEDKIKYVLSILSNNENYTRLLNFIRSPGVECAQITQPKIESDKSYSKHITDVVNARTNNKPYSVSLKKEYRDKNNWQLFIDNREHRLCLVIWSINPELY